MKKAKNLNKSFNKGRSNTQSSGPKSSDKRAGDKRARDNRVGSRRVDDRRVDDRRVDGQRADGQRVDDQKARDQRTTNKVIPDKFKSPHPKKNSQQNQQSLKSLGLANIMPNNLIMGRNTIKELYKHNPDIIKQIFCTSTLLNNSDFKEILSSKSPKLMESTVLDELFSSTSHQGIGAEIKRQNLLDIKFILNDISAYPRVLLLDAIQDAHNLGAILRAADCFGISAVIFSSNRSVDLSPVVSKVSMGASELLPICDVGNLGDALVKLKKAGYWTVLADANEKSQGLRDYKFPEKVCLILGSEGQGASNRIQTLCDETVYIEQIGHLQSLNVSQAASVLFYSLSAGACNKTSQLPDF